MSSVNEHVEATKEKRQNQSAMTTSLNKWWKKNKNPLVLSQNYPNSNQRKKNQIKWSDILIDLVMQSDKIFTEENDTLHKPVVVKFSISLYFCRFCLCSNAQKKH